MNLNLIMSNKEQNYNTIIETFYDLTCYKQLAIHDYTIDLYISDYKLVIECDEFDHVDGDQKYEQERQTYIENKLKCKFIIFNPDAEDFTIHRLIKVIMKEIMQQKQDKMQRAMKQKQDDLEKEINKLKIENNFLNKFYKKRND